MKTSRAILSLLLLVSFRCPADTGVIVPSDKQSPDPSELSIESLRLQIRIDNGHALVHWDEVFRNKTNRVLEGTYLLTLPDRSAVSDFAVWDDVTRIPGVILERKRAGDLYAQIRNTAIDPGLLESGEVTESTAPGQAQHSSQFSVKIVPIPAYGYKRIEAEYRQDIPLNQLAAQIVIPLKSSAAETQTVPKFSLTVELASLQEITSFEAPSKTFPLTIGPRAPGRLTGSFETNSVSLNEDFILHYTVADDRAPRVQAYRNAAVGDPGWFEASAILQPPKANPSTNTRGTPRTVIVLFDTSLSMQWEKLETSFQALEATLRSLKSEDRFNVITFDSEVKALTPQPASSTPAAVAKALDFVRAGRLAGGTNLQKVFAAAFAQAQPDTYVVLLSDGGVSEGVISPASFARWFDQSWNALGKESRPHIYTLAIGDDANSRLLAGLAEHAGVFEQIGSAEPLEFKLNSFIRKIGLTPLDAVTLTVSPSISPRLVYRLESGNFPGARASWVGEYQRPGEAHFTVESIAGSHVTKESTRARLPADDSKHAYLPAAWARARIDALLQKIYREGEDTASIDEVIQLSRRYRIVTPYTSFLAAPRALLRPRLIRPGDPLLRVRTDASVMSVVALFPFGLVKPLRYLKSEDVWQTRFLAPPDLTDGVHAVRLLLRDREGHVYREQKNFIISSHAPLVRIHLESAAVHPGTRLALRVQASETTRTIAVRLYGAEPLFLHWDEAQKSNTGSLTIPAALPAGRYSLHVTAEDIAHNVSHQEVPLEILP